MPRRVPIALLRQLCYPVGYRLPKLEHMIWPPPRDAVPASTNYTYSNHTTIPYRGAVALPPPSIPPAVGQDLHKSNFGNLPLQDYRFFAGRDSDYSEMCKCRWCGLSLLGPAQRKLHRQNNPCDVRLTEVYKRMRHAKRCGICDKATDRAKWGVPLCSEACKREFMFSSPASVQFYANQVRAELCTNPTNK